MNNILMILVLSISFYSLNCTTEPIDDYVAYKIKVNKITTSDTISVNDTLVIKFDGFVGSDGCHRFKNFEIRNANKEINITVWGEKPNYDAVCTQAIVYLRGKEYKTKLNKSGDYKIIVHQPDNTKLYKTVNVK